MARKYHKPLSVSRPATQLRQRVEPEDQRILDRLRVIRGANSRDGEPETFVQLARSVVRAPDFQRRPRGAEFPPLRQDECEQRGADRLPPEFRQDGEIVDVQFVEDVPEGTEAERAAAGVPRDEAVRNGA